MTILLLNQAENLVEAFCGGDGVPLAETTSSVLYTGDHYDALRSPSSDELSQVRGAVKFEPWRHSEQKPLAGGFLGHPLNLVPRLPKSHPLKRLEMLCRFRRARQPPKLPGCSEDSAPSEVGMETLVSWSLGGWRAGQTEILGYLLEKRPLIIAAQEMNVPSEHQSGVQKRLAKYGHNIMYGHATPWATNARGQQRAAGGVVPGFPFVCHEHLHVQPLTPLTPGARKHS